MQSVMFFFTAVTLCQSGRLALVPLHRPTLRCTAALPVLCKRRLACLSSVLDCFQASIIETTKIMVDDDPESSETALLPGGDRGRPKRDDAGAAVRRKLTACILLYTIGASMMTQVYPKIILLSCGGDDGEASKYRGWLAAGVSVIQLLFIPAISGSSDVVGRKAVVCFAQVLHAGSVLALAAMADSLAWATVCRLATSVCIVILPVSQAIMIDLSPDRGKGATHGLGIAFGACALGFSAGDIIGGSLAEHHRGAACLVSAAFSTASLLSLTLFGWRETAPPLVGERWQRWLWWRIEKVDDAVVGINDDDDVGANGTNGGRDVAAVVQGGDAAASTASVDSFVWDDDGRNGAGSGERARRSGRKQLYPLSVLKVFLESRALPRIACSYFLFVLSLNVFATGYNYVDYRFGWTPSEISYFFATYNILMALAGGWVIRFIVPKRLTEEKGALFGISVQVFSVLVCGLCFRGWMLYPALVFGALQNITEPCLQAIMATFIGPELQGSLQGAVMSLRVVGEGVAAPLFTQVFSAGASVGFEEAPFFLATAISLVSLAVAWWPLRKLNKTKNNVLPDHDASPRGWEPPTPAPTRAPAAGDEVQHAAEGDVLATAGGAADDNNVSTANAPGLVKAAEDNPQDCADDASDLSVLASGRAPLPASNSDDRVVDASPGDDELPEREDQDEEQGMDGAGIDEGMRQPLLAVLA